MRIIYEPGDYVERLTYIESAALRIKEVQETGVVVEAFEHPGSDKPVRRYYDEFVGGKFLSFADIKPASYSLSHAILVIGDNEVDMAVVMEQRYKEVLAKFNFDKLMEAKLDWADAPEWAVSQAVCDIETDATYGTWCWCSGTQPVGFIHVEVRPVK